jgi:hypothetical protein
MGSIEELAKSIDSLGVLLQPIVITRDNVLRAGERRWRACKSLGWTHIPCHYIDELDEVKLKRIELEENIKRKGMEWNEECTWLMEYHEFCSAHVPGWSQQKIADEIGMSQQWVSQRFVTREETKYNPDIWNEPVFATAHRKAVVNGERRAKAALDDIRGPVKLKDVHHGDFCEWVKTYEGPRFNFIHCDFPFGINTDKRQQGNIIAAHGGYDDSRETNLTLMKALCDNLDRICADSAHIMFWFSMHHYHDILSPSASTSILTRSRWFG